MTVCGACGHESLAGVLGDEAERARLLGEARRGYAAIGAPKHAERVARELEA